ncbi:MAG: hypothetical protein ABIN89_30135 [Chitinophagaceae bacterium]
MALLIDVIKADALSSPITLQQGDVLSFKASGGHVNLGEDFVELLGPFASAILQDNGEVLSPMGPPGTLLFHARQPGNAKIDVVTGDPFFNPLITHLEVIVT